MVAVTVSLVAFFGFLIARVTAPQMSTLFTDLTVEDSGAIVKELERQGIDFFVHRNGNSEEESAREVDRYCSWPGQACGYKVGHSTMVAERERARGALGVRFDLRGFDQAVVDGGNVPLDVLAKNVGRYIARARR